MRLARSRRDVGSRCRSPSLVARRHSSGRNGDAARGAVSASFEVIEMTSAPRFVSSNGFRSVIIS
eukprot:1165331-Prymnesium_polylepis.2